MPESLHSLHTLSTQNSSLDSLPHPQALESTNRPRRPSMLQRFTSAASSFMSGDSEQDSHNYSLQTNAESRDALGLAHLRTEDDWFGSSQIQRSLSTKPDSEAALTPIDSAYEEEPVEFVGGSARSDSEVQDAPQPPPLRRRESTVVSTIQSISKKLGFWDSEFQSERIRIVVTLITNYMYLLVGFAAALCIYWGAYYDRSSRYKNVQYAVFIGDTSHGQLVPVLGELVQSFFQKVPAVHSLGDFKIWSYDRLLAEASKHNNTIQQEVYRQVHHQRYRAAFYVHENATLSMYNALVSANSSFNPASELLSVVYETGSDYNAVNNYISTLAISITRIFASFMTQSPWVGYMMQTLNSTQIDNVFSEAPQLFTSNPHFKLDDRIPVTQQVVQAPLQVGLIYLCIFTFFQFVFSVPIHQYIASKIKGMRYVMYRIAAAQTAYVVLSLSYVLLNIAFQISFTKAFGHSGFLVIWAFAFLTMSSVGCLIELFVLICIIVKPAMIGLVLLFVAVSNLAPVISPIVLCPDFYRYGWAMPVRNSYELMQVAFFNSWKGNMGRNIGILVAWILVSNALMPFVMKWMSKQMMKKAQNQKS